MSTTDVLRVPPHSVEAEQSVLGGLLQENMAWDRASELLTASDFYRLEHRQIFDAIAALVRQSRPADVITVFERLQSVGKAEDAGGLGYLNALAQGVPSAANTRHYAEIVRERSILRQLAAVGEEIAGAAMSAGKRSAADVLEQAEASVLRIGRANGATSGDTFKSADVLAIALMDRVQELAEGGGDEVVGLRTGFGELDAMTAGLQKGDLIVLAGRPSMGKTAFALNIVEHVAVTAELPTLVFSLEMPAAQLTTRMVSALARIDQQVLRTGRLRDGSDDWHRLSEAVDVFGKAPLFIDDGAGLTVSNLRARARRKAREVGGQLALIVIDYLQLMAGDGGDENRTQQLAAITAGLKGLAKELDCPVIVLSQLNRGVEARADKRPMLSDLRDSGAIEQDADVVIALYRDDYYTKDASKKPGVVEVDVLKQRNGPVGMVEQTFLKRIARFESRAT